MIDGPIYTGGSKYFNESTGKYEFANEQEYQDFIADPGRKSNSLPEGSYVIGNQDAQKTVNPTNGGTFGGDGPKPGVTTGPELNFEASVPNQYAPYGQYSLTGKPGPDYPDPSDLPNYGGRPTPSMDFEYLGGSNINNLLSGDFFPEDRLNEVVSAPTMRPLRYDPKTIRVENGIRVATAVRSDGTLNPSNTVYVDAADQRRQEDFDKRMAEFNAQQAALGEGFTNAQLRDYKAQQNLQGMKNKFTNIEQGFFDSPEFEEYLRAGSGPGTMDMAYSPYFGDKGSGSISRAQDAAYEKYLRRTGNTGYLQGGQNFTAAEGSLGIGFSDVLGTPEMVQPTSMISSEIGNMTDAERLQWAQMRQQQRDVKNPEEQALINSILNGTYAVPTTAETTVATTNTDVSGLPAYTPPAEGGQQQIISTQPQSEAEVNVMDYYGVQANQPTLQPSVQLAPQTQQLEIQPGEIQGVPQLGATPTAVGYTAQPELIAEQEAPTVNLASMQTTSVVDRPQISYTEAAKSITAVSEAADALQAAQQDLSTVDPRATVQGQLALLQKQFDGGETPIWAQGAMRQVSSLMAQRGLGASSVAAEAITNALMQSALPIAQQDSSFYQNVTLQNLANDQQAEMAKFNARLTSIFNDQAAENTARNINAASDNEVAQFFANLSQNVALTNTAAYNAMEQFNSTASNQSDQFAAELGLRVEELNTDIINEMSVFNAEQLNTLSQFNATMKNNREQFQVQNQIAIDASNVGWRRDVNTANTATLNAAIQMDVQNLLGVQQTALNNIWDHYDTLLNFAFKAEESAIDRATQLAIATLQAEAEAASAAAKAEGGLISGLFTAGATILSSNSGSSWLFGK